MFDSKFHTKRAKQAMRFFTYGVMTISVVLISAVCILLALGYRFDRQNLTFSQGALIQVQDIPNGANVSIDGKDQGYQTPGKSIVAPGKHTVTLTRSGYHTWTKSVQVVAGQLLQLNYARLIPLSISTKTVASFGALTQTLISPDHKWMVAESDASKPEFTVVDLQNPMQPSTSPVTISADQYTLVPNTAPTFTVIEWDLSSRYFLVKYQAGSTLEYLRVDRSAHDPTINITKTYQLAIDEAHFSSNDANVVYVKDGDVLRRLNLGSGSSSDALITGVKSFSVYGANTVAYVAVHLRTPGDTASAYQVAGLYRDQDIPVHEYPVSSTVIAKYAEYFGHGYMAATDISSKQVDIFRDPLQSGPKTTLYQTMTLSLPATWLSFSPSGRLINAQTGNTATTYDLEVSTQYSFKLDTDVPVSQQFTWLDDFYLITDTDGLVRIFEFDGTNEHDITKSVSGQASDITSDGTYMFSISKNVTSNKYELQISQLLL